MKPINTIFAIVECIIGVVAIHFIDNAIIERIAKGGSEEHLQWWLYSTYILLVSIILVALLKWRLGSKANRKNTLFILALLSLVSVSLVIGVTPFINQLYFIEVPQIGISNSILLSFILVTTLSMLTLKPNEGFPRAA